MAPPTPQTAIARIADRLRTSLWVIPGALIVLAAAGAVATVVIDHHLDIDRAPSWWAFHAGPQGARATLSAIASSIMTVAGLAFSITIVVLQLSSSQFSPRVVRSFLRDRLIQFVLGAYMGTFTYALIVLRAVTSAERDAPGFAAPTGVTIATTLALLCMVLLVVFVHHVAQSIQVASIIGAIAGETRGAIEHLYPDAVGQPALRRAPPLPDHAPLEVAAPHSGYLDYVDPSAFDTLPPGSVAQIVPRVGDYVYAGEPLARAWCAQPPEDGLARRLARGFAIEPERTMQQDARFGLRMIADVALRAVSPGINDPTTACYCVNVLGNLLGEIAGREWPPTEREEPAHGLWLHAPRPGFGELVDLAFGQVLWYGREDPLVVGAVAAALAAIATRTRERDRLDALAEMSERVVEIAEQSKWPAHAVARVVGLVRALRAPRLTA